MRAEGQPRRVPLPVCVLSRKTKAKQPVRIIRFAKKVAATMSNSRKVGYIADKQENQLRRCAGEQNTNMLHS
jgi:hypothetical protein